MSTTPRLMAPDEIYARLLAVDIITAMNNRSYSGNVNRPVGLQMLASMSVQDARQILGQNLTINALATYHFGR